MEKEKTERRGFFSKILSAAVIGGLTSLLLGHRVEKVTAPATTVTTSTSNTAGQIAFWDGASSITGSNHLTWEDTNRNFIGGYSGNSVTSGVIGATISGGGENAYTNKVTDHYGTVGGGYQNQAGDNAGDIDDKQCATVSGGEYNTASGHNSTVGGGDINTASGPYSTVGGGNWNIASTYASIVGGGNNNTASGPYSTVGGGEYNTASGQNSTVGGGTSNIASGSSSTVSGGYYNKAAGHYSFASGRRAKIDATHHGAFLFADQNDPDFNSVAANEFAIRCTGGARFVTVIDGSGNPTQTISMTPSGYLGVGTTSPARSIHLQGSNACFRMDRDVNSAAFILVRTASGDFNTIWKTFYVGVDASGVNDGEFFIGDAGTNVSGASTQRLRVKNNGNVWVKVLETGDIKLANDFTVTEDEKAGVAFKNSKGEKIAILDEEGNLQVKGKITENPNL